MKKFSLEQLIKIKCDVDRELRQPGLSDKLILLSILKGGANKGVSLKEIIANGDLINRAIFTKDELVNGLSRLDDAGLISQKDGSFIKTKETDRLIQFKSYSGGLQSKIKLTKRFLEKIYQKRSIKFTNSSMKHADFIRDHYENAVAEYNVMVRDICEKVK